jgi:hypothetical protein
MSNETVHPEIALFIPANYPVTSIFVIVIVDADYAPAK